MKKEEIKIIVKRFYKVDCVDGNQAVRLVLEIQHNNVVIGTLHRTFDAFAKEVFKYSLKEVVGKAVDILLEQTNTSTYEVINFEHFIKANNLQQREEKITINQVLALYKQ